MSYIVQNLLKDRIKIKTQPDLESEDYNNLLIIEKKIGDMVRKGALSDKDLLVLEYAGGNISVIEGTKYRSKIVLAKKFYFICQRIAFALGGEFTDEGYLHHITRGHDVTEEELNCGRKYMIGRYRYKIMRKI